VVTFLHTADWQLGIKLSYIQGDKGALQREVRVATLDRIVAAATTYHVDFVMVAGDAFDDNGVSDRTVRRAIDRLRMLDPVPVYFLPGNHDALTADSVYRRDSFQREKPANVHLLDSCEPVAVPGVNAVLLPCPLLRRHEVDDPTRHLRADGDRSRVRVGVAHGAMDVLPEAGECANRIDPVCVERGELDYLGLGDWHGTWNFGERIWYSGTHEQTKFSEDNTGNVLVVSIDGPGSRPAVRPVRVAQTTWMRHETELNGEDDITALEAWYESVADRESTLVELILRGTLGLPQRERLDALLRRQEDRLRWQRVVDDELVATASFDDLDGIATGGFVRAAIERLREEAETPGAEGAADACRALQLLYRLHRGMGAAVE
jgi:DNA repair exonuclease SbcCD nuclease subunit